MIKTESFEVNVNPKVLEWAIKTSGWEKNELVLALTISENTINGWLSGDIKPTIKQLELLSNKTKRPLAAFFLPEPPEESPLPKDYRMLPNKLDKFERKTLLAIRKARYLQEIGSELSLNINKKTDSEITPAKIEQNPEEIALFYRKKFSLSIEKQTKEFTDAYKLYNYLRDIFEDYNIFSFQISMPLKDARGFVLTDKRPMLIVVNSGDNIEPRIFTLLHEFGHVLLGESSISIPDFNTDNKVERWCNKFAAAFLMPSELAKSIFSENKAVLTETKTLNYLSRKYKVSKAMLLYNMLELDFIKRLYYQEILDRHPKIKKEVKKQSIGIPQERKCLSDLGNKFVSLVADNLEKNLITYSDALTFLSIKSRNLDKVIRKAKK